MEANNIEMTIEQGNKKTTVQVDNSSDFKDLVITQNWTESKTKESKPKEVQLQVDDCGNLKINNIIISDIVLEIFLQFVNQAKK